MSPHSHLFKMSCAWGFTSASVALGSSYFQRLLDANAHLGSAVKASVHFAEYVGFMRLARQQGDRAALAAGEAVAPVQDSTLLSIQFTCVYLASKVRGGWCGRCGVWGGAGVPAACCLECLPVGPWLACQSTHCCKADASHLPVPFLNPPPVHWW